MKDKSIMAAGGSVALIFELLFVLENEGHLNLLSSKYIFS